MKLCYDKNKKSFYVIDDTNLMYLIGAFYYHSNLNDLIQRSKISIQSGNYHIGSDFLTEFEPETIEHDLMEYLI